jgi:hypothetical protein
MSEESKMTSHLVVPDELVVGEWYWSRAYGAIKVVTLLIGKTFEARSMLGSRIFVMPVNIYTLPLSTLNFHMRELKRCGLDVPESLYELMETLMNREVLIHSVNERSELALLRQGDRAA